jgi:8-oxo-dGTP pyrophosphatase MutT (NUDIX family)
VVRSDGAVLMQHQDNKSEIFWPDYWAYPAGAVEESEDFEMAAKRELEEETGYKADHVEKLVDEIYFRTDGQQVNRHIFWTLYDRVQQINCYKGQEMKFVAVKDFSGKKFLPGQERLFKLAIKLALKK